MVRAVITAAYAIDRAVGPFVEVAAVTRARVAQIARLVVADLQDGAAPRVMMPTSWRGRGRKPGRYSVAITPELAKKLASNRSPDVAAPRQLWQSSAKDYASLYRQAAKRAGITGTIYALRHSSIIRALLRNVPTRVVAAAHDTSVAMIERTYSAFIADFFDALTRGASAGDVLVVTDIGHCAITPGAGRGGLGSATPTRLRRMP